ncbi:MAG: protein kinase, partial [Planctomycetota bacterium]
MTGTTGQVGSPDPLDEVLERLLGADAEERSGVLRELVVEYPELAPEIEQLGLDLFGMLSTDPTLPRVPGYSIERPIGRGGMARVYLGTDAETGTRVAIKILSGLASYNSRIRSRFVHEAQLLTQVRHPNIVAIGRVIETPQLLAYSMEWIEGPTLERLYAELGAPGSVESDAAVLAA